MKFLMQSMRQWQQRRLNTFFFSGVQPHATQLPLGHIPRSQDRTRSLREMFAEQEYDTDDEPV